MNKQIKEQILEALENKSDEEIDEEFSKLIREDMTQKQFMEYFFSWKDGDSICDEMEEWDTDTKREEINNIRKNFLK